jgi:acetyl-CoA carboxylase carboxyltransferase component
MKGAGFALDLLAHSDIRNPYDPTEDQREINIYKLGKWPIDVWARETFDNGIFEELKFDTIDSNVPDGVDPRVAAKVYKGEIKGHEAIFYMKDSRINGGATGDLEGLKYIAAVYVSYLKGVPLYVWNDGAGANILQGMVSLNRGAEGFTFNTMSSYMGREDFLKYAHNSPDKRASDLCRLIDNQLFKDGYPDVKSYHYVTAVGIGSSAGLDVYGSSQAPIQMILDHEQSYRVLTGSNVIRSVMGENISNYEIGGARVMSKWAGIVDLVAGDKFHLISDIRRIHNVFSNESSTAGIDRSGCAVSVAQEVNNFSENMVMNNVDKGEFLPFKHDYYGSGSVVAGFAKIGGRRVCIIGPRSDSGLSSFASVTRAREILRTASRTNVHPILVLGKKWHHDAELYDNSGIRARIDFVNTLASHNGLRICIVTDIKGFHNLDIVSHSDVIIFVKKGELDVTAKDFIESNASFIADSLEEAFDISCKIIDLVDPVDKTAKNAIGVPDVPSDSGTPYNMIDSVINKIADNGDFIEFYSEMNSLKTRSNFITGLAKINGETVGILADQPLILGGGADAPTTEKFRIFTAFLNRFGIRLLMLSNSSGFIPGTKQERLRIQAIGAEALDTNIIGKVPVVSIVVNQNYGGRQIQSFNKYLRPGIYMLARENATMAVLGHTTAFDLFKAKKYRELIDEGKEGEAESMRKEFIEGYLDKARACNDAYTTGVVDEIITDIKDLRGMIIRGFDEAVKRCNQAFK